MKTVISLLLFISLLSCKKEPTTPTTPTTTNDIVGNYTGIISTQTQLVGGSYSSFTTNTKNVEITETGSTYYIDGNPLSGGPEIYSLSINSENYLVSLSNKNIQYTKNIRKNVRYIPELRRPQ